MKVLKFLMNLLCVLGLVMAFGAVGHDDMAMAQNTDFAFKATLAQAALGLGLSAAGYGMRLLLEKEERDDAK